MLCPHLEDCNELVCVVDNCNAVFDEVVTVGPSLHEADNRLPVHETKGEKTLLT